MEEVARRLNGGAPSYPERGDWSTDPQATSDAWSRIEELITAAERALDQTLTGMDAERLAERVGGPTLDVETGAGVTYEVMLHGIAQHNSYHGGQISLLKKMLS